jgi:DNA-binding XRE family transcriptional regulator
MARNFSELEGKMLAKMTPARRAEYRERVAKDTAQIRLSEVRKTRKLSQAALAAKMGTDQGSISRIEKGGDLYLSTLRSYVESIGGRLEARVVFPDQTITLKVGD